MNVAMPRLGAEGEVSPLAGFLSDECDARMRAYSAQPRDAIEHFETENDVLSGGYAYRQLFELVQNAADAILEEGRGRGRIHVCLAPDVLVAANTGAALDKDGIVALLNARSSSKRGEQIGRFGIGFKSLLKLGGSVDIVSRTIGLRFNPEDCRRRIRAHLGLAHDARAPGMRLAEAINPHDPDGPLAQNGPLGWATTVVIAAIADLTTRERLAEEMAAFPAEFVLFLPAEIDLTLEVSGGPVRRISKHIDADAVVVADGSSETRWRLFETQVRVDDQAAKEDATHIQARDEVPLAWAVPLATREQAGRFWAFFPTETQTLGSGILNAPWKLNSDRTNLIRGPWNTELMKAAAALVAKSMPSLSTEGDPGAPISALPRQLERQDELAATLVNELWKRLVDCEIVPDGCSHLQRPAALKRHAIAQQEAATKWSALAEDVVRRAFVHPSVYANANRVSRLNALATEATKRGHATALASSSPCTWLEAITSPHPEHGRKVLLFARELIEERHWLLAYLVGQPRIIPTARGGLAAPNRAMLTTPAGTPAGFEAVAPEIAGDQKLRAFLSDTLGVPELDDEQWEDVLGQCEAAAANDPNVWHDFWTNFAAAPAGAAKDFLSTHSMSDLGFRCKAGGWASRGALVGPTSEDVPDNLRLDIEYHTLHRERLPDGYLDELPPLEEEPAGFHRGHGIQRGYRLPRSRRKGWLDEDACRPQSAKLSILNRENIVMPAGWRLLPRLPSGMAARLTARLINALGDGALTFKPVKYGHMTRQDLYPTYSAPHPILYWLHKCGRVVVGEYIFGIRFIEEELASWLDKVGIAEMRVVVMFRALFGIQSDLGPNIALASEQLDVNSRRLLWEQIAALLAGCRSGFDRMRPIWNKAAAEGFLPLRVPTSAGPQPLGAIFVTHDSGRLAHQDDDGTIIVLSQSAVDLWIAAGAQPMDNGVEIDFDEQFGSPTPIVDLFPELAIAIDASKAGVEIYAAWVCGLEERTGPRRIKPTVARTADGLVLIDRIAFERLGWRDGITIVLRALLGWGLLQGSADDLLACAMDHRVAQARRQVREARSMPERLLLAVGGSIQVLLDTLSLAARQAVGENLQAARIAELVLAVHGPTILGKVAEKLAAEGLDPPIRWGGEAARTFALETGFPLEFASSARVKREGEITVSGPIHLPQLHDYQEEILSGLTKLFSSGAGRRRAVVSLPTGGGKTRVAAEAVVRLVLNGERSEKRSALWIAQTDELCEQAVQCFRQLWVNIGMTGEDLRVVRLWGGQSALPVPPEDDEAVVVIASIQTINNRFDVSKLDWLALPGVVVIDECHHAITKSYSALLRWLDVQTGGEAARKVEPPVLGLSATPWRGHDEEESARLAARFDRRWFPADQHPLYDRLRSIGVLARLEYRPIDYSKPVALSEAEARHFDQYGELSDAVVERIAVDPERNNLIIDAVLSAEAGSILLFANSVAHAQYLAARLHLAGCSAAAVSGGTDRLARQHFVRRFRSGEIRVLCNYSVLTTGFDAPRADMILISRPVFSPVRYMQMVGRGLRAGERRNGGLCDCHSRGQHPQLP